MPVSRRPSTPRTPVVPLLVVGLVAGAAGAAGTLVVQAVGAPDAARPDGVLAAPVAGPAEVESVRPSIASAPTAPSTEAAADVERLAARFEAAEAERAQLAATVVALSREVGELTDAVGAVNLPQGGARAGAGDLAATGSEAGGPADRGDGADAVNRSPEERALASLVAAGLDPGSAAALKRRQDDFQLARLELVDRAAREGWEDSDAFEEQLEALEGTRPDLRAELGDDGYDRYLAESGAPNRIGIAEVIPGSAADVAGLQPGDIVVGYADGRVFEPSDLQSATRGGTRGEPVSVLAERDGQSVTVSVPRGPLGITLSRERRDP